MKNPDINMRRLTAIIFVFLLAISIAPGSTLAHAQIATSVPAGGATVASGLTRLSITFTEDVSPEQSSAELDGPNSKITAAASTVNRADRTSLIITTPALAAGIYTVKWTAVTENDNAQTNGSYTFTVSNNPNLTSSTAPARVTQSVTQTSSLPDPLLITLAVLFLLAAAATIVAVRRRKSIS